MKQHQLREELRHDLGSENKLFKVWPLGERRLVTRPMNRKSMKYSKEPYHSERSVKAGGHTVNHTACRAAAKHWTYDYEGEYGTLGTDLACIEH